MQTYEWDPCVPGALRALQTQLTNSMAFVAELMLNAYQAGATRIHIEWEADPGIMSICDDGCGMKDFRVLFGAHKSSSDAANDERERSIGTGFMCAIVASDYLEVLSLDQRVSFDTRDPFERRPVNVYRVAQSVGTEFRLHLRKELCLDSEGWTSTLKALARGFSIPVHFGGEALPRPHALDQGLAFRASPIGQLYLDGSEPFRPEDISAPTLYWHGLPLSVSRWSCAKSVLHVDPHRFATRSPGRDKLDDAARHEELIESINEQWREQLAFCRERLAPQDFVDQYWVLCWWLGIPELLRDMPLSATMLKRRIAPVSLVVDPCRDNFEEWDAKRLPDPRGPFIKDTEGEPRPIFQRDYFGTRSDPSAPLASVYALVRGLPVVDAIVPGTHWAAEQAIDLHDESLGLSYEPNGTREFFFHGPGISFTVLLCESYTIHFRPQESCKVSPELRERLTPVCVTNIAFYDNKNSRIVVPSECQDAQNVLMQVSSYENEDDVFEESAYEQDRDALARFISTLRAGSAQQYLELLLNQVRPIAELLGDQRFQVSYKTDEGWQVELMNAGDCTSSHENCAPALAFTTRDAASSKSDGRR